MTTEWLALPKVELHVHLDGALSYEAVRRLAPEVSRAEYQARFVAPARCRDLPQLFETFAHALALLQTEEGLRVVTEDLVAQLAADHVVYAEIRFAPLLHTAAALAAEDVVAIVAGQLRDSARVHNIEARLLVCTLRHFSAEQSLHTARLAVRAAEAGMGVVGLDPRLRRGRLPARQPRRPVRARA